jgi:cytochrome c
MDNFELNKIMASFLIALIVGMAATLISEAVIKPEKLLKNVMVVELLQDDKGGDVHADQAAPLEAVEPLLLKASLENGEKIGKRCLQCHTLDKGGPHKIGPNLWGVVGLPTAHRPDYPYSKGLMEKKGAWDFKSLNEFLNKPSAFVKGTKMSFAGIPKAQERADLIRYLQTLSDNPIPLPAP